MARKFFNIRKQLNYSQKTFQRQKTAYKKYKKFFKCELCSTPML